MVNDLNICIAFLHIRYTCVALGAHIKYLCILYSIHFAIASCHHWCFITHTQTYRNRRKTYINIKYKILSSDHRHHITTNQSSDHTTQLILHLWYIYWMLFFFYLFLFFSLHTKKCTSLCMFVYFSRCLFVIPL